MVITYHGGYFVKASLGDTVIAVNPFSKDSTRKSIRFGASIGLISMEHPDMNGEEQLAFGEKEAFIIRGPGEYEVGGISIVGVPAPTRTGVVQRINTIYALSLDGVRLCFLGALASPDLSSDILEGIGDVDILFVPVSGGDVLSPAGAEKVAVALGAKLVIPIAWDEGGEKQLDTFLKEAGAEGAPREEKLTLKKKDLEGKDGDVVILVPQSRA
jgi:L-ascorbate metabolism protein UlaG (beta-lactamase superfamily)